MIDMLRIRSYIIKIYHWYVDDDKLSHKDPKVVRNVLKKI